MGLSPSFLLVRQQLERIDQVVTQPQRCCVCFDHHRFSVVDTELHHRYLVGRSPFVLASTCRTRPVAMLLLSDVAVSVSRRYPPNVVFQRLQCGQTYDKVTPPIPSIGAMIRRKKSVLFLWISCTMPQRVIHCHLLISIPNSFKGPFTEISFLPAFLLETFSIAMLQCDVGPAHRRGTAICIRTSFDLFQNLLEGRLLLPLTLLSFLFFVAPALLTSEILTHSVQKLFAPGYLPLPTPMRLLLQHLFPFLQFQGLFALLHQLFIVALLTQDQRMVKAPPHLITPPRILLRPTELAKWESTNTPHCQYHVLQVCQQFGVVMTKQISFVPSWKSDELVQSSLPSKAFYQIVVPEVVAWGNDSVSPVRERIIITKQSLNGETRFACDSQSSSGYPPLWAHAPAAHKKRASRAPCCADGVGGMSVSQSPTPIK